jgi:hypothetical protein
MEPASTMAHVPAAGSTSWLAAAGRLGRDLVLLAVLAVLATWIFAPALGHDFVNYDDESYVTGNPMVTGGLTWESVDWAFTAAHSANWHPLTWLSHMIDVEWHGLDPRGHHQTNNVLHALNTVLLFLFLRLATRRAWLAALVAAFFAAHPLHVESVAWVAERKDVLSTSLGFLALIFYTLYAWRPSMPRYALVLIALVLGLMAKPMLVTWPFLFLLLDVWPLGRVDFHAPVRAVAGRITTLVLEKAPLLAFCAGSAVITFYVQRASGAVAPVDALPLELRVANAAMSYVVYLRQMVWPVGLAVPYPFDAAAVTVPAVAMACALLGAITLTALVLLRRAPWIAVGWGWYLGLLVPVIGIVQVGEQAHADRYTYVPLVGVFIMVVYTIGAFTGRGGLRGSLALALGCALVAVCAWQARVQVAVWRDSETLFRHALAITGENTIASNNLGKVVLQRFLAQQGQFEAGEIPREAIDFGLLNEASGLFEAALTVRPGNLEALHNLATARMLQGRLEEAAALFAELTLHPRAVDVALHVNYGAALLQLGDLRGAQEQAKAALALEPDSPQARLLHTLIRRTREAAGPPPGPESLLAPNGAS